MIDPSDAAQLGVAVILIVLGFTFLMVRKRGAISDRSEPNVRKADIWVSGWTSDQLDQILDRFLTLYSLPRDTVRIRGKQAGWTLLECGPIYSDDLCYLVNYLHYPEGQELVDGAVDAAAVFPLPYDIGPAEDEGAMRAKIYVPVGDDQYDLVHGALPDGRCFAIPFTNLRWKPLDNGRMSARVKSIPFD